MRGFSARGWCSFYVTCFVFSLFRCDMAEDVFDGHFVSVFTPAHRRGVRAMII